MEEATTIGGGDPGSDVKIMPTSTSKPAPENGASVVPIHVLLDNPLPMKMAANEDEMRGTSSALSRQDNAACDGKDPDHQVRLCTGVCTVVHAILTVLILL